jgi:hypothetical protein
MPSKAARPACTFSGQMGGLAKESHAGAGGASNRPKIANFALSEASAPPS